MLELQVDDADAAARTAAALLDGAIGVVPTDTVYGLAAVPMIAMPSGASSWPRIARPRPTSP